MTQDTNPLGLAVSDVGVVSASTMERIEAINDRRDVVRAASRSASTLAAYSSDWRGLQRWAHGFGYEIPDPDALTEPLPVNIIDAYLVDRSDPEGDVPLAAASLTRSMSAVKHWHRSAGLASPTDHPALEPTLAGVRRLDTCQPRQAAPIYLEDLAAMVQGLGDSVRDVRDRALLLLGWWGAFRRSELVGLDLDDLGDHPEGIVVTLRRSKTDQESKGLETAVHYQRADVDPVRAVRAWQSELNTDSAGALFRGVSGQRVMAGRLTGKTVARVVKQGVERIGFDPARYSAHSLRAGHVSECDRRGIPSSAVRMTTHHQSEAMLATYTRPRSLFEASSGRWFHEDEA